MQPWSQFYATIAAASAALLGLLFVAVSINAPAALGANAISSRRLTEQAFQNYLAVMMVSLLALFPDMSVNSFGRVTLYATAVWSAWVVIRFFQTITQRLDWRSRIRALRRHISSLIGFAMLLVSALRMALNRGESFDWFAAAVLVLLFSATTVSWELLRQLADRGSNGNAGR